MYSTLEYYQPSYPVTPEKFQKLVNHLTWQGEISRDKEPGTLRFEIYESHHISGAQIPGLYVYKAFTDEEALRTHLNNEAIKHGRSAGLQDKLISHIEVTTLGKPRFSFSPTDKPDLDDGE